MWVAKGGCGRAEVGVKRDEGDGAGDGKVDLARDDKEQGDEDQNRDVIAVTRY